jgi:hypothetical protein
VPDNSTYVIGMAGAVSVLPYDAIMKSASSTYFSVMFATSSTSEWSSSMIKSTPHWRSSPSSFTITVSPPSSSLTQSFHMYSVLFT